MTHAIFGVRLDDIRSRHELRARCSAFLAGERAHLIFTPNPNILLLARTDPEYVALLNSADLLLPDGIGILLMQRLRGERPVRRWPGVDAAELLLGLMAREGGTVLVLGGHQRVAQAAAERVRRRWPALTIETGAGSVVFRDDGTALSTDDEVEIERLIKQVEPQVVLVSLGAPKQERWIHRHAGSFPSVRIMMGIGGALDMWAGRLPRAPRLVSGLGLEWLWRLTLQPSRFPRAVRATLHFPWYALGERSRR
jgi:N-acetylglucosaminyldiphosphoundecaprenol N-acetyl-beta-D-mannosaminyltransferase